MPPVTTPARIELAEILLEPAPTPFWRALRQIGVDRAVGVLPRHHFDWREARVDMPWDYVPLKLYQELLAEEGFSLDVIEDNPPMDAIRLGRPGREEEFEIFAGLVRNMGRLGIPVLCYNWAAVLSWLRTSSRLPGRAGAAVSGFDAALLEGAPLTSAGVVPSERLWETLDWFLERVVPVAEEAGVRLAMHPDDPPLPSVRGIDRIHSTVDGFRRLLEMNPSEFNGITMCQGNFALMTDDLPALIREFGGRSTSCTSATCAARRSASSRRSTTTGQTDMLACMRRTATSATRACCVPTTCPRSPVTPRASAATPTSRGCTRSATRRGCARRSTAASLAERLAPPERYVVIRRLRPCHEGAAPARAGVRRGPRRRRAVRTGSPARAGSRAVAAPSAGARFRPPRR